MCGICGIYNFENKKIQKESLKDMNDQLIERGPDSEGYYINNNFGMAMRRLSIIDIKNSIQPMQNKNKNITIIFNGEIYNFIELRNDLKKQNVTFNTNGDTEVILRLYEMYNEDFVNHLIGMFSICIYDLKKNKTLIYRDRFGIKPLYYHHSKNQLIFSSSLNSFKKILNGLNKSKESFLLYLCFNYFPSNKTAYENVYSLPPVNFITIQNNKVTIRKYFDTTKNKKNYDIDYYDPKIIKTILEESVAINLRSDVNSGLMLSSGLDSSIIAKESSKITKELKCYTVDFEKKIGNESQKAKRFANELKFNHETINLKENEAPELLIEILSKMDEPCGDTAIIPTYLISKKAKLDGLKILLSGAGGDEIFAGYSRHYLNFYSFFYGILNFLKIRDHKLLNILPHKLQNIFFKSSNKKYAYMCNTSGQNLGVILNSMNLSSSKNFILDFIENFLDGIVKSNFGFNSKEIINADLSFYLPDNILRPFDKVCMINSIEGRVPLLDHRIMEILNFFKQDMSNNNNFKNNKKTLRNLYSKILPDYLLKNDKKGFNAPLDKWNLTFDKSALRNCFQDDLNFKLIKKNSKNKNFTNFLYNLNTYNIWAKFN